jgi:molybdopterin molybdotransferase
MTTPKLRDDCFLHSNQRLTHAEALAVLRERIAPVAGIEPVALGLAAGRVLAEPAVARHPVPAHTNAAVDGYAFDFRSYDADRGATLPLAGRAAAGHPLERAQARGTASRIFTGAVLPHGADTVVMQEDVRLVTAASQEAVHVPPGLKARANVRRAGEDVQAGETLLGPGHVLRPQDIAALASIGFAAAPCYAPLEVAIVSTGDEIVPAGERPLREGEVYDANAPMLRALADRAGARVTDLGIWPDRAEVVEARLAEAARSFHLILTSGGASRGEEDHMAAALAKLGRRHLWQIAIKPGRPILFGQIGDTVVLGLPGNPVAVFVCFLMYVFPVLRRLGGAHWPEPRRFMLPAAFEFPSRKVGRREFWRGRLVSTPEGLAVDKFARDGSGLISGLRAADGLIDVPEDVPRVRRGDPVAFIPFAEFGVAGG